MCAVEYKEDMSPANVEGAFDAQLGSSCPANTDDCMMFLIPQLCAGGHYDMNYYYSCRNILMRRPKFTDGHLDSWSDGLLHSPPAPYEEVLKDLLHECVQTANPGGRRVVFSRLREQLDKIRHLYDADR